MLAPPSFIATAPPVARSAPASIDVMLDLPFVADTTVTAGRTARCAATAGDAASMTRPGRWSPEPRPSAREALRTARPAQIARRSRVVSGGSAGDGSVDRDVVGTASDARRRFVGSPTPFASVRA